MFILLFITQVWAQTVVVPSISTPSLEYQKYLSNHPDQRSFIEFQRQSKNKKASQLLNYLKKAQFEFLNGSLEKSHNLFMKITNMRHDADWKSDERQAIHFAFLRAAQLEQNQKKKEALLFQALSFDESQKADQTLFPPPLVNRYLTLKKESQKSIWKLPHNSEFFEEIRINGESIKGNKNFIETTPGKKRVSFISNKYASTHFVTEVKELQNLKIPLEPLATGDCQQPVFSDRLPNNLHVVYFDHGCTTSLNNPLKRKALFQEPKEIKNSKTNTAAFYKSKWFWLGASVVVAGLTWQYIDHQNNQQQTPPPPQQPAVQPAVVQTFSNQ